ncbi:hypothetical protein [Motilibacter deserti]|uniref:Integral membrane protein n=1 Tax=Motilibacter deserti TaxID=2714956 RepID=A0ABX0GS51_9ACTN|nr:hypothetical protein [Motilibacter deserti]NHC12586.1 hypothetical protein [Motilibacter deserti]
MDWVNIGIGLVIAVLGATQAAGMWQSKVEPAKRPTARKMGAAGVVVGLVFVVLGLTAG